MRMTEISVMLKKTKEKRQINSDEKPKSSKKPQNGEKQKKNASTKKKKV